jgi:methyl-accepting chemotaxis protein
MKFESMKVSQRLALGFGVLTVLAGAIAGLAVWSLSETSAVTAHITGNLYVKSAASQRISYRVMDIARIARNVILLTDEQAMAKNKAAYEKDRAQIDEDMVELEKLVDSAKGREVLDAVKSAGAQYFPYTDDVIALGLKNKNQEATALLFGEKYKLQGEFLAALNSMVQLQEQRMKAASEEANATYHRGSSLLMSAALAGLFIGLTSAVFIARSITRQLGGEPQYAAEVARRIAEGDLVVDVEAKGARPDSLIMAMKTMRDGLARIVGQVRTSSETIASGSSQIASGNQELSSRTEEQASSLEQTAASMEELTTTVRQSAENAKQASQLAGAASAAAAKGGDVVGQVVATMNDISSASRKISEIINVIDGIAFQTNILALNAAVEAARAGEQGRGFAVVAGEVRNLAQRSAQAAREIKAMIGDSVQKVEAGSGQVNAAGASMQEIVAQVQRVTDLIAEITSAAMEQSAGIGQVNDAMSQMDRVTQQNAALVEESAAAAENLNGQAQDLARVVALFKIADAPNPPVATASSPSAQRRFESPRPATAAPRAHEVALKRPNVQNPLLAAKSAIAPKAATAESVDSWQEF